MSCGLLVREDMLHASTISRSRIGVRSPKASSLQSSNDLAVLSMKCNVLRILGRFFARQMCDRTLIQLSWISRKRNKETFVFSYTWDKVPKDQLPTPWRCSHTKFADGVLAYYQGGLILEVTTRLGRGQVPLLAGAASYPLRIFIISITFSPTSCGRFQ